jgi:Na+-driven multidrug efflux pump
VNQLESQRSFRLDQRFLNYIGISLVATVTIFSLQKWGLDNYAATAGAYGINTRVMTFAVLPLLGLSMAFQTIVGNNFGANAFYRSNRSLKLVLWIATAYCALVQLTLHLTKDSIGMAFVDDPLIAAEISRIIPMSTMMLVLFGPVMMLTAYFQAIGDSSAAAILGLSRTYLFALPFVFCLPYLLGENGIWYAGPSAEFMMLMLALVVLLKRRRQWAA